MAIGVIRFGAASASLRCGDMEWRSSDQRTNGSFETNTFGPRSALPWEPIPFALPMWPTRPDSRASDLEIAKAMMQCLCLGHVDVMKGSDRPSVSDHRLGSSRRRPAHRPRSSEESRIWDPHEDRLP